MATVLSLQSTNAVNADAVRGRTIVGEHDGLRTVFDRVNQVAVTDASVLLLGETGTGKELIARAIHQRSHCRHRPFVVVNCGAMPASLIESELFGRERGAFTGAHNAQAGRFEIAHGGTIFLDEIGELPFELQPKLLRVLQEGEIDRLGCPRTTRIDVRVIAATNRNLMEDVRTGKFRRDLFYRLNVFPIVLPALRERRQDVPALVRHLCDRLGRQVGKTVETIAPGSFEALFRHDWPGNIRELENVILQGLILSTDRTLDLASVAPQPLAAAAHPCAEGRTRCLVDIEGDYIVQVLQSTRWRIEGPTGAAQILGLRPSTLRSRMIKLGIRRPEPAAR